MQVPVPNLFSDVKYYTAKVRLDSIPRGLLPNMSAEVEILTARRPDVLTVPPESIVFEDGQDFCYIAHEDRLERRAITLGDSTEDLMEVVGGLDEGDEIVLDASLVDAPATPPPFAPVVDSAG
jgi:HlyD family secretion protein